MASCPPLYLSCDHHTMIRYRDGKVAVLQPFLKRVNTKRLLPQVPEQDQLRATATRGEAVSKLEEAVSLVDTLGCEVVLKEVQR